MPPAVLPSGVHEPFNLRFRQVLTGSQLGMVCSFSIRLPGNKPLRYSAAEMSGTMTILGSILLGSRDGGSHHRLIQRLMIYGSSDFEPINPLCFGEAEMVRGGI
jgi:hypothetical protein